MNASPGRGIILTMGWDQAETGMEGDSGQLFAAAKGAVMAFTKSLALTLAPEVRVNALAPGWIRTAWGEQASEVWQDRVLARNAAPALGNARRRRPRRPLAGFSRGFLHHGADHSRQWRSGAVITGRLTPLGSPFTHSLAQLPE